MKTKIIRSFTLVVANAYAANHEITEEFLSALASLCEGLHGVPGGHLLSAAYDVETAELALTFDNVLDAQEIEVMFKESWENTFEALYKLFGKN